MLNGCPAAAAVAASQDSPNCSFAAAVAFASIAIAAVAVASAAAVGWWQHFSAAFPTGAVGGLVRCCASYRTVKLSPTFRLPSAVAVGSVVAVAAAVGLASVETSRAAAAAGHLSGSLFHLLAMQAMGESCFASAASAS